MSDKSDKIAQLNDAFRKVMWTSKDHTFKSRGIAALAPEDQAAIFELVRTFNDFSEENDPHGEHDFGAFDYKDERIFWKIDYYDSTLTKESTDPADATKTHRVMTIMLAQEY